jgi:hypothetical protein
LSQIDESQVDAKLRIWKNINTLRKSIAIVGSSSSLS